jgi:hypothetical protein
MRRAITFISFLGLVLTVTAGRSQSLPHAALKVFLNEVQPGAMSAPQYCTLVFNDHHFHTEKADIQGGRVSNRKVYEGQLSDTDWNTLTEIIDSKSFRQLKVPGTVPPPVMQNSHPYAISVAREDGFQNIEFLDNRSLKPYESQVKPLLSWWKSLRGRHTPESNSPPDTKCALDSSHAIFSQ